MTTLERINHLLEARNMARQIRDFQRKCIGLSVIERMPNGNQIAAVVVSMSWQSSYGLGGGWAVRVRYTEGDLAGQESETSDTVLTLGVQSS